LFRYAFGTQPRSWDRRPTHVFLPPGQKPSAPAVSCRENAEVANAIGALKADIEARRG
jgi:hypothetical protein